MPIRVARHVLTRAGSSRAGQCLAFAALALLLGSKNLQNAVAEGDTRTLSLHHIHTGEDLTITFKRDGRYDDEALKKINHLLRDWRRDEEIRMDPRLLDVVWEVYREVDAKAPIQIVCGYRAPATNAMLRRRSRGVAEYSQHMLGRAMDFFIPGVSLEAQREAGLRLQRGGVGYYPSSGSPFVHMDVSSVRYWPHMSREQLARVFPDGRTVHIPSDGQPMRGYALALADIEKRGSSAPSQMSLDAARTAGVAMPERPRRSIFTALFNAKDDEEDETTATEPARDQASAAARVDKAADTKAAAKTADAKRVALPTPRPTPRVTAMASGGAPAFNLASAESRPAQPSAPRVADAAATASSNDVIASRGYWEDPAPKDRMPVAAVSAGLAPHAPDAQRRTAAETAGALARWPLKMAEAADRVPPELALAYAAQARAPSAPATRAITVGAAIPRNGEMIEPPPAAAPQPRLAVPAQITDVARATLHDPWLRALVLAPDLQNYMTATLLGQPDMRELRPLMDKPDAVVAMRFGDDPQPGLSCERFTGSAVVFISTVTFEKRTVALQ